jgi:hypothetical protein
MRIRINNPAATRELLAFLLKRVDCVAQQVGADELQVSILGSYCGPSARAELEHRLHRWRAMHPAVAFALSDAD